MSNSYLGLLYIILPLIVGYFIPLAKRPRLQQRQRRFIAIALQNLVYGLLLIMGGQLSSLGQFNHYIVHALSVYSLFFVAIITANILLLLIVDRYFPLPKPSSDHTTTPPSIRGALLTLAKLLLAVAVGYLLGLSLLSTPYLLTNISQLLLLLMLLLVGIELGNSQIRLSRLLLNRHALFITSMVIIGSALGSLLAGYALHLPVKTSLALSASYGWYTLSSVVLSNNLSPVFGAIAFFNDLSRELLAILLIPFIAQRYSAVALGICGATSLDMTLPILQKSAGNHIVPCAISQGIMLTLLAPILLTLLLT